MHPQSYFEAISNRLRQPAPTTVPAHPPTRERAVDTSAVRAVEPNASRFVPVTRLGRGRAGEIYEAIDNGSDALGVERRVALQAIEPAIAADPSRIAAIGRLCAVVRDTPHPNVVRVLDFVRENRSFYVVMELLSGTSLRAVLDTEAPHTLTETETLPVLRGVGDALRYLHAKGIVHGNLRAENVFVTFDRVVKLLDLLPAKVAVVAPYYVEDADAASRGEADARDDVYGLACLAYELLSGRHPFNANSPLDAHRAGMTPAPLTGLGPGRAEALTRALALRRSARTPSVANFLREFGVLGTERLDEPAPALTPAPAPEQRDAAPVSAPAALPQVNVRRTPRVATRSTASQSRRPNAWVWPATAAVLALGIAAPLNERQLPPALLEFLSAMRVVLSDVAESVTASVTGPSLPEPRADVVAATRSNAPASVAPESETILPAPAMPTVAPPPANGAEAELAEPAEAVATVAPVTAPAEPSLESGATPAPQPPAFARLYVRVSEGQGAATLTVRRGTTGSPASFVWWAKPSTAYAEEDFADFGQRSELFRADEQIKTILVPIVNDTDVESTESFSVYLGQLDRDDRSVRVLSSAQVEIVDDD
jgi:serine/threonine protein kinase